VSALTERTFVLQDLYKAPKIADFLHKPQNNPASIWRDLPHIPDRSLHANLPIYFSHRLLGHEKRSSFCSGLQKPEQPHPKSESKFKDSPLPLNTAGICSNRLDLGGHVAPRI